MNVCTPTEICFKYKVFAGFSRFSLVFIQKNWGLNTCNNKYLEKEAKK